MKKMFILSVLVSLLANGVLAQKVKYKKDQVTIDDKPYCTITSKGFLTKDYTVKNLEGKTIMTMKIQSIGEAAKAEFYYLISFIDSGNQCEFDAVQLNVGTKLAEDMVESGVLADGKLSEEGEKRFLKLHKRKFSEEIDKNLNRKAGNSTTKDDEGKSKTKAKFIERNRESEIEVWMSSKDIKQDFKKIGYYTEAREGMKIIVSIYLTDDKKIAKVVFEDAFAKQGNLTTFSDDEERMLKVSGSTTSDWVKLVAKYLVDRDYL